MEQELEMQRLVIACYIFRVFQLWRGTRACDAKTSDAYYIFRVSKLWKGETENGR